MIFAEIAAVLLFAVVLAWLFTGPLGRPGPWGGFWWFFLVLFLGTLAVAAWTDPVGPAAWGVAWAPILVAAFLIALLLAAIPPRAPGPPPEAPADVEVVAVEAGALGLFFWLFVVGLVLVVGLGVVAAA